MGKILLVNAPYRHLYGKSAGGISYYFPLGLGYLASYLEKYGHQVELMVESPSTQVTEELSQKLRGGNYDLVGISSMTSAFGSAVDLAGLIKRSRPELPVVMGGPHVSGVGPRVLREQPNIDYLCLGEGEITMLELVRALRGEGVVAAIQGLVWRDPSGQIVENAPRPFHSQLDDFPPPARHLVKFNEFSVHSHVSGGSGAKGTVMTSRGCPFGCLFCSAHLTDGQRYRFHSDDYVMQELHHLKNQFNISYFFVEDDTFTLAKPRVKRLCQRIIDERLNLTFGCFSRVDVFDGEMAELLSRAGCRLVIFGIESGVPEVLAKIGKRTSVQQAPQAIKLCRKYGIKSYASFVVGFPFETRELIQKTLDFGLGLDASILTFNPLVPFPGTALFKEEFYPSDHRDWARFLTTGAPPFNLVPHLDAQSLKSMCDRAHLRYYLRPSHLFRLLRETKGIGEYWSMAQSFLSMLGRASRT